ncbi:uncharacterized protein LOC111832150 [Capsella rubella]|uniref:uncharacterized protein LOC111832150 n=1 Tax=Capsella rubella TaxID=81985 RepID=UPI000CD50621|nr:uncharacterized protein LOC111832150 [Capsella rubella]
MAIKTDMSKAYDRVEWDFLEELLIWLGFDIKWVTWIMSCVRSVSYSVLINGSSYGFFKPERGIRQGDPLSPFLFILCAEALVHIMNRAETSGILTGMRLAAECPSLYGRASGQEINFQKSSLTFSKKMDPIMKRLISLLSGITQEGGGGKYLGLPECFSGSKAELLSYITDRLKTRLSGWYEKTLSLGGMELPVYAMSCFRLSKHQCKKINSVMSSFWWNATEDKHKMHWVSWEKLCKSKPRGGLGFRDIGQFNQALLAKQAWCLIHFPDSLFSRVYKAKYFPVNPFLEAKVGYRPSYAWRSIIFGRELLEKGLMKSIGNGANTSVWLDKWVLDDVPRRPYNKESRMNLNMKVADLITSQGEWDTSILQEHFLPCDITKISSFPPSFELHDRVVWALTKDGNYSVKSGYWLISHASDGLELITESNQQLNTLKEKVWTVCGLPLPPHGFSSVISENIEVVLSLLVRPEIASHIRTVIPWLLWGIWKARNGLVFSQQAFNPHIIFATAVKDMEEWCAQQENRDLESRAEMRVLGATGRSWLPPAVGTFKCNIHSSWINDSSFCGGA